MVQYIGGNNRSVNKNQSNEKVLQNFRPVNRTALLLLCYKRPKWGGLEREGDSQNWGKLGDDTLKRWPKENDYDR